MRYLIVGVMLGIALASDCTAQAVNANTREHLISGYTTIFRQWDRNGDKKLSYPEIESMVDTFFRWQKQHVSDGRSHPELEAQRYELIKYYESQDVNHHGYLTLDDFLRAPLASFDCMDANRDGRLSGEEVTVGMDRCPSLNLGDYAQKP